MCWSICVLDGLCNMSEQLIERTRLFYCNQFHEDILVTFDGDNVIFHSDGWKKE